MQMQTTSLKRVLFVDDSLEYLELIRRGIAPRSRGQWELMLTHDTSEALAMLDSRQVDLIVSDLDMSPMDGMQFLKLAHQRHPHIRKAMLTGVEEAQLCRQALREMCDCYLLKPRTRAGFDTVFHTLNQLFAAAGDGFRGLLHKVSLTDLLQLECLNRRSSILEMSAHNLRGRIYIQQGAIVHAEAGTKIGTDAFIRLMQMPGGDFQLKPYAEPPEQTIATSWEHLLMEAADHVDRSSPEASLNDAALAPAEPVAAAAEPMAPKNPRTVEVLVSGAGEQPLYTWQCDSAPERMRMVRFLEEKCRALCERLSMGAPAQVDMQAAGGRVLAHFQADRRTFCRTEYQSPTNDSEATHV